MAILEKIERRKPKTGDVSFYIFLTFLFKLKISLFCSYTFQIPYYIVI